MEVRYHTESLGATLVAKLKLFVRIRCMSCRGSRRYSAGGTYDPLNPTKWSACPYCDSEGKVYIEAALSVIINAVLQLSPEQKQSILQKLTEEL
jgi:uncharacterized protein CbrC (UPF0167 family)